MSEALDYSLYADLYDSYVRTDFDIPFWLEEARRTNGEVLELMAGTGRVTLPLAKSGIRLVCVDSSPDMLVRLDEKLRKAGVPYETICQDVTELDLGRTFPLIFIPFHAFAEILSADAQRRALKRICSHIQPGGKLVISLHNPPARLARVDGVVRLWADAPLENPAGGRMLVSGAETRALDEPYVTGFQAFEIYDRKGVLLSKRMVRFQFRLIEQDEMQAMAEDAGLRVKALYGDYDRSAFVPETSRFMIWCFESAG